MSKTLFTDPMDEKDQARFNSFVFACRLFLRFYGLESFLLTVFYAVLKSRTREQLTEGIAKVSSKIHMIPCPDDEF